GHTRSKRDWSSDVCSSDLIDPEKVVVVHNGIDTSVWARPEEETIAQVAAEHGIDPHRPAVIFVGRITRQKGLGYLLAAAETLPPEVQLILCAGAPDTPELAAEVREGVRRLQEQRTGVVWISEMLPLEQVAGLLAAATVFVRPSIYEPLGIVNLEAMAVGTAVVGSATGGIPEVVDDGSSGLLVPLEQLTDGTGTPLAPERFVADLAAALAELTGDP